MRYAIRAMQESTALLVIDMQVCNFGGDTPVYKGRDLLSNVGALIGEARVAGIPIIYVQHCGSEGSIDQPNTPGWEIHPDITPYMEDVVIQKRHPDAFQNTGLQVELETISFKKLIIAGIQTEYCIDTTCRSAYSLGYDITLVSDGHSTWDSEILTGQQIIEHHNRVLGGWFVTLVEAGEVEFDTDK
jgi:nicotinamidase-related amidase